MSSESVMTVPNSSAMIPLPKTVMSVSSSASMIRWASFWIGVSGLSPD